VPLGPAGTTRSGRIKHSPCANLEPRLRPHHPPLLSTLSTRHACPHLPPTLFLLPEWKPSPVAWPLREDGRMHAKPWESSAGKLAAYTYTSSTRSGHDPDPISGQVGENQVTRPVLPRFRLWRCLWHMPFSTTLVAFEYLMG